MPTGDEAETASVLVVARHPFRLDDLGFDGRRRIRDAHLIRRPGELPAALEESEPDVVLVDTGFADGRSFEVIEEVLALAPNAKVLALTPDPAPYADVARSVRAGAAGFIDINAEPESFLDAVETVHRGEVWYPSHELPAVFSGVAEDLNTTRSERRSRLTGILLGLIPLTGLIAAIMAYLWRKYLGQIGVRPVDLAVDPASRVVDAIVGLSTVAGAFGPLLYVGTWLEMLRGSRYDKGPVAWLLNKPKTAYVLISLGWLLVAWVITRGPDPLLVLVVGPSVAISVTAQIAGASNELPPFMRINLPPRRILVGGLAALLLFLAMLGAETILIGPDLRRDGAGGLLAPRVLGFKAQPMQVYDLEGDGEPRDLLYLGGNADLYVLADPCNDNTIELVSVGRHRLVVTDEIECSAGGDT